MKSKLSIAASVVLAAAVGTATGARFDNFPQPAIAAPSAAASAQTANDHSCTRESLAAISDKSVRQSQAKACVRRGTFKPSPAKAF